jgi:hypothetical protein
MVTPLDTTVSKSILIKGRFFLMILPNYLMLILAAKVKLYGKLMPWENEERFKNE